MCIIWSRLNIYLGEWEKGKGISESSHFRGGKLRTTWNKIAIETGRRDVSLKKWYELYEKHPTYEDYEKITEKQAKLWTDKVFRIGTNL